MEVVKGWKKVLRRTSRESFTILIQARGLMELSKVALEKRGDCHVKRARSPIIEESYSSLFLLNDPNYGGRVNIG
jgi:hypothetical protein